MIRATLGSPATDPWRTHEVRLRHVTQETPGVATYQMAFVDPLAGAGYEFRPGQFNMLYLPGCGEIPISLSGDADSRGLLLHTVRLAGNGTRALARLQVGATLGLRGAFGNGWPVDECRGKDLVIVAGGIGLAPLRPVIHHFLNHPHEFGRVTLLYGDRAPENLLFASEWSDWTRHGLAMQTTVDRASADWMGNVGVVPLLLERLRPLVASNTLLFTCGPEVMMRYAVRYALARGIEPRNCWVSLERNMQCAVGLCGHCQFGPAFVCRDGPVVRYDRMAPFLNVAGL